MSFTSFVALFCVLVSVINAADVVANGNKQVPVRRYLLAQIQIICFCMGIAIAQWK